MAEALYTDIAAMRNSSTFQDRVVLAVTNYARYILGNAVTKTIHEVTWAQNAYQNPSSVANGLYNAIALDPVISDTTVLGAATDAQIKTATETAANQILAF